MADLTATYKGNTIAEWTSSGTKTFQTSKKYCEDNIVLNYNGGTSASNTEDEIITRTISGQYINSNVTKIGAGAFYACKITSVSCINCISIMSHAFEQCTLLKSMSFPKCEVIAREAFRSCVSASFKTASFSQCTNLGTYAFYACYYLSTAKFPKISSIWDYTFAYCSRLKTTSFPSCINIGLYAFSACKSLATISFPVCQSISSSVFNNCVRLKSLYLMSTSVVTLANSNAFTSTPIGGYSTTAGTFGSIYVPSSLLASYKAATNWTYFSSRFVGV